MTQLFFPPTDFDQTKRIQRHPWYVDDNCLLGWVIATPQAKRFADNPRIQKTENLHLHDGCNYDNYSSPRRILTKPSAYNITHGVWMKRRQADWGWQCHRPWIVDVMAINQRDHDENVHCFKISHEKLAKIKNRIFRASRILPMADPHKHPIFFLINFRSNQ